MKYIFLAIAVILIGASLGTYMTMPQMQHDYPVVYWVTDNNATRRAQLRVFHDWLDGKRQQQIVEALDEAGMEVNPDLPEDELEQMLDDLTPQQRQDIWPNFRVLIDAASHDRDKHVIQGVSGVAGDLMDVFTSTGDLAYYREIGMLADVTEQAEELGFSYAQTYEAIQPEINLRIFEPDGSISHQQLGFPANVTVNNLLWVNADTFRAYGLEPPSGDWTIEEFEEKGRKFVEAANPPGRRRAFFFADDVQVKSLYRSMGLDTFNETMTRCTLDDERYLDALRLKHKWIHEDRILPTAGERQGFEAEGSHFGEALTLFRQGNYAMIIGGRYFLVQFREWEPIDMRIAEPPHAGFRNASIGARVVATYSGGDRRDLTGHLVAFMASEAYNRTVVDDGDALPGNPEFVSGEEHREGFRYPEGYSHEWEKDDDGEEVFSVSGAFGDAAENIAIGVAHSPFINQRRVDSIINRHETRVMNNEITAEEAAERVTTEINREMERSRREIPHLREIYRNLREDQEEIERLREAGEPVPVELLHNPFHRRYYIEQGWAEEPADSEQE